MTGRRYIFCQLGAREHYYVARILHREAALQTLVTDAWISPTNVMRLTPGRIGERLRGRYHEALAGAHVVDFTAALLLSELKASWQGIRSDWAGILDRNEWFQECAVGYLKGSGDLTASSRAAPSVLAYSYSARKIFRAARAAGAETSLLQIDGGRAEEDLVAEIHARCGLPADRAPPSYWEQWGEECALADSIIVNSQWSRSLLLKAGIESEKIKIAPLGLSSPAGQLASRTRNYPDAFSRERPLRLLFLGSVIVRKGISETLEAAERLRGKPVHFDIVGPDIGGFHGRMKSLQNVSWHGAVPRSEVGKYFSKADAFLFPTHSDGFGLVQLEAQQYGLPIITSRNCGQVVEPGITGLIVEEVSAGAIQGAVCILLSDPRLLEQMSTKAVGACMAHDLASQARFLDCLGLASRLASAEQKMSPLVSAARPA